jgi:hypothetical protein
MNNEPVAYENTDKEIWREIPDDYYAPSIFVTAQNTIGINVGGSVHVKHVHEWHRLAHPIKEHFEDEQQAEELHEIMQSNAELTDEEIAVIGDKCFGTMSYELWVQTNEFARAILRKTQEADKIESLGTVNIGGVHFRNGKEVK